MNYRTVKLLAESNYTAAGTKTIEINIKDPISRLIIAWRVTRVGEGMDSYPHADISKIELLDGSEVLHSLSGGENQAVCIYDRKGQTMNHGQHLAGNAEYSTYGIDFGRYRFDPMYAFDPARFRNPQLKITHSHLISDTGASSGNLEVWAELFDEKAITPVGFFSTRQIKDYSVSAAGVYDYIELPTDYPLRGLFIQGYAKGYEPWYQVIEARLSEDGDKRVPFDWNLERYHQVRKGWSDALEEQLVGKATTSDRVYYVTPTCFLTMAVMSTMEDNGAIHAQSWCKGGKITIKSENINPWFWCNVRGYLPNHMFHFPFGDQMDPADWYDVPSLGSLELRVKTGANTSGNIRTTVQQVRTY